MPTDLFVVAIGEDPDVNATVRMVSPPAEKNVFMAATSSDLRSNLRALTDTVCEGGRMGTFCQSISQLVGRSVGQTVIPASQYIGQSVRLSVCRSVGQSVR